MRTSDNHYLHGQLQNGYDYDLQVWVKNGIILDCGHPVGMSRPGYTCCKARRYNSEKVTVVRAQLGI